MKIKVYEAGSAGALPARTIQADQFERRENGTVILVQNGRTITIFGPGFRGYLEIEYESYDRGS